MSKDRRCVQLHNKFFNIYLCTDLVVIAGPNKRLLHIHLLWKTRKSSRLVNVPGLDPPQCGLSNFCSALILRHCCFFSSFYSLSQISLNTEILPITLQDRWLCLSWEASSAWTTNTHTIILPRYSIMRKDILPERGCKVHGLNSISLIKEYDSLFAIP